MFTGLIKLFQSTKVMATLRTLILFTNVNKTNLTAILLLTIVQHIHRNLSNLDDMSP